ncbi:MAG: transaldolase [Chloroflexi bacterium]|nr:transaldolase [Chloroflexota bacterium]|tara:strand:+ start:1462 stop:2577 length:1116 start_codon:yes stop_codon:yes gene_type:complete
MIDGSERLSKLNELGQSVWYDNISRDLIEDGRINRLITTGVRGLTSNPSIFEKAVSSSNVYDDDILSCDPNQFSDLDVYERLAIKDIQSAADLLNRVYASTGKTDGFVSLEVNPHLAHDTESTINEGQRLFDSVGRSNLMIKVPATKEGLPAITELISRSINVNVTLIFSNTVYGQVREAYLKGLEKLEDSGGDLTSVSSVASFFVSRVDTLVDSQLVKIGTEQTESMLNTIAIANAKLAYRDFKRTFSSDRFAKLEQNGANLQRPLWASTSTKNPHLSDVLYVDSLIGNQTVNTMPDVTLDSFLDHGCVKSTLETGIDHAESQIGALKNLGVDLESATEKLTQDGVKAFQESFDKLMAEIGLKRSSTLVN